MAKGSIFIIYMAALTAVGFQSCLKEKDTNCPPVLDGELYATVAEKNYENVDEITQVPPVDENLPFSSYVGVLDVLFQPVDIPSGAVMRKTLIPEEGAYTPKLPTEMPADGQYTILVTGNAAPENFTNGELLELHPQGTESGDAYLAQDIAYFPLAADRTMSLRRTKGQLLLFYQTLPQNITRVGVEANGVSKNVDRTMAYSGLITVAKDYALPAAPGPGLLTLLLAPTVKESAPELTIRLYDGPGNIRKTLSDITLDISRNRISALELRYDPSQDTFEIWMNVEGEWVQLHQLTID